MNFKLVLSLSIILILNSIADGQNITVSTTMAAPTTTTNASLTTSNTTKFAPTTTTSGAPINLRIQSTNQQIFLFVCANCFSFLIHY